MTSKDLALPDIHVQAFDGTDTAECGSGTDEPRTWDVRLVTCQACLVRVDDITGPGRFPFNPGD